MNILAIDPGSTNSAYAFIDETLKPLEFAKVDNDTLLRGLPVFVSMKAKVVIELIGHYGTGMPAGKTVFDTCIWIGRYIQALAPDPVDLVLRAPVKTHLCGNPKATDANVTQALVDRFAIDPRNHGKGTKAEPGFFYGFYKDIWQAYALAVYYADTRR